jgi:hypothetical protein
MILRKAYSNLRYRAKELKRLFSDKSIVNGASYFPEYADRRKSKSRIFWEQLKNVLKYGDVNDFYYLYGFDIKGLRNEQDYVDYARFRSRREELMHRSNNPQVAILRDKFFFSIVSEALGFRSPKTIAVISNDSVYLFEIRKTISLEEFVKNHNLDSYVKLIDGECANGVFQVVIKEGSIRIDGEVADIERLRKLIVGGKFLVQERIYQHEKMSKIFPKATNSVRITSLFDKSKNDVIFLPCFQKSGLGDVSVDNWAIGGLIVGLDVETGKLKEWAYYKPGYGKKTKVHPDTGVVFKDFEIPFFNEAKKMIHDFHMQLKEVHSIGWDITITPDGPCIIEGNDNWEISALQVTNHGMKKEFEQYM